MIGIGYRRELAAWIDTQPPLVQCLEITADHFFAHDEERLVELAHRYPLFVHGLGLSLGTPGPLDEKCLDKFARVVELANPLWISEHVAFTRTTEVDLGHLNPVQPTRRTVRLLAEHAREMAARCRKPLILENITSHLRIEGELSETDFLNELCAQADCGLLLDVTNLFINSHNHCFDPLQWLREIEPARIVQLHIVGYSQRDGRWQDGHGEAIQVDLLALAREVVRYAPVRAIVLERDENFPNPETLTAEVEKLANLVALAPTA
jgi:uncharacterized protein (UPF0276 family)